MPAYGHKDTCKCDLCKKADKKVVPKPQVTVPQSDETRADTEPPASRTK